MSKIIEVIWIETISGTIGIVLKDNGFEKKAYIKQVMGLDEASDTRDVLENGGKLKLHHAESILKHLKESEEVSQNSIGYIQKQIKRLEGEKLKLKIELSQNNHKNK